ncbi:unnamed protein product, partial [Effrenium voratum]
YVQASALALSVPADLLQPCGFCQGNSGKGNAMPIDYSKFDDIEDEEEAEGDWRQLLEQLSRQAPPDPRSGRWEDFGDDLGYDLGYDLEPEDPGMESYELDFQDLHQEAWCLLRRRLVGSAFGAASVRRRLLLEAELCLRRRKHRPALLAALALRFCCDAEGQVPELSEQKPEEDNPQCWVTPAAVVEMVCAYQLGDRDHAALLRDALLAADRSLLSRSLEKRFQGTAEGLTSQRLRQALWSGGGTRQRNRPSAAFDLKTCGVNRYPACAPPPEATLKSPSWVALLTSLFCLVLFVCGCL